MNDAIFNVYHILSCIKSIFHFYDPLKHFYDVCIGYRDRKLAWNGLIEGYIIETYVISSVSAAKRIKRKRNSPETFTSFLVVKIFSKSMSFRKHSTSSANYEIEKWYPERHYRRVFRTHSYIWVKVINQQWTK